MFCAKKMLCTFASVAIFQITVVNGYKELSVSKNINNLVRDKDLNNGQLDIILPADPLMKVLLSVLMCTPAVAMTILTCEIRRGDGNGFQKLFPGKISEMVRNLINNIFNRIVPNFIPCSLHADNFQCCMSVNIMYGCANLIL